MKKILIIPILIFLIGCSRTPHAINNYQDLDTMLTKRSQGEYSEVVVYDLRDGGTCYDGHIKGFTCIFYQNHFTIDDIYQNINIVYSKKAIIILICEDGTKSLTLATRLTQNGYHKVYYFVGGYQEYQNQNPNYVPEIGCDC